ncbi:hypothetical protein Ddye_018632 [Dipteronia dyeriana]|uniref:Diacylglycerol O-acyltransferase n=1 Tax=Dipteronia dyeriana TaxID=168575 RepID=A0AAD9UBL0_9ROSI|nr:hypothetical protein Ddye_018632 [Dipteronia dyeriana]
MEYLKVEEEGDQREPVSPTGQFLNSEALSLCILGVLELGVPISIDESHVDSLVKEVFLPTNPRFSSIMVEDENGEKQWKRVEVKIKDHIKTPIFPSGLSPKIYDKYIDDYISDITIEKLPVTQPLWQIHLINYPTSNSNAASTVIFKFHHSIGDGFSLIGVLLSCLQRADDPSLPLTFPSVPLSSTNKDNMSHHSNGLFMNLSRIFSVVTNTVSDFYCSIVKSCLLEDDISPIRSGISGVEFLPVSVATMTFSLDHIKRIKSNIGATLNDVLTGIIFLGTRLYMEENSEGSSKANSTALVLLNTREFRGYVPITEMIKPDSKSPWGNYFAFLHVPLPKLTDIDDSKYSNPLEFVLKTRETINTKKSSLGVYLTGRLLQVLKKLRGTEAAARYLHETIKNTSMGITSVMGPVEPMTLANHPVTGLYFMVVGAPHSLVTTIMSYNGKLRIAVGAEKGLIDAQKLKSCIENAFQTILKAACDDT